MVPNVVVEAVVCGACSAAMKQGPTSPLLMRASERSDTLRQLRTGRW